MKLCITIVAALAALQITAQAIIIPVPLPPPGTFTKEYILLFNELVGEPLNGQSLTLEFPFTTGQFVRLYPNSPTFITLLVLHMDPFAFVDQSTYIRGEAELLVDPFGNLVFAGPIGSVASADGLLAAGLVLGVLPTPDPLDVYGVRYAVTLPTLADRNITSAELRLVANGQFGIGPGVPLTHLPESGSAWVLLIMVLSIGSIHWLQPPRTNLV